MKIFSILAALTLTLSSGVFAAEGDAMSDQDSDQAAIVAQCTEAGADSGLTGEELQAYVETCVQEQTAKQGS